MVFQNKIVTAIKVSGRILRENENTVTLPFGAEYSILIKNMDSRRVQVKVSVDGKDATEGTWLVIGPNSDLELERFIRNGNFENGNRFKFIERTSDIEEHRGIGAEDGLIRVEYKREKIVQQEETIIRRRIVDEYEPWPVYPPCPRPRPWPGNPWKDRPMYKSSGPTASSRSMRQGPSGQSRASFSASLPTMDSADVTQDCAFNPGITVPGSQSNQKFVTAQWFQTEAQSEVIVLKLRGQIGEVKVQQ